MAELNSLDWVFDSVSFGDFEIFEIRPGPKPVLTLVYADPRLSLLRSIRRHVILKHNRHFAPRFVRDQLEAIRRPLLKRALEHYEEEAGAPASETLDMAKVENLSQQSLIFVDAEDDLLFAASWSSMQVRVLLFQRCSSAMVHARRTSCAEQWCPRRPPTPRLAGNPTSRDPL
jgi:hypothetical protein